MDVFVVFFVIAGVVAIGSAIFQPRRVTAQ
jgi:hypothetical protein